MYQPFKFVVQAVLADHDDDDAIVGEAMSEPVTVYGLAGLQDYVDGFYAALDELNGGAA